jgi:predicted DNA-binding transcriptional regulator YafY
MLAAERCAMAPTQRFDRAPLVARFRVVYENSKKRISRRLVDAQEVVVDDWRVSLVGYCHEQDCVRTFHDFRILELTDIGTGEVVAGGRTVRDWLLQQTGLPLLDQDTGPAIVLRAEQ